MRTTQGWKTWTPTRGAILRAGELDVLGMILPSMLHARSPSPILPCPTLGQSRACVVPLKEDGRAHQGVPDLQASAPDAHGGEFRRLLGTQNAQAQQFKQDAQAAALDTHHTRAYDLLTARRALEAFDLSPEDPGLRSCSGTSPHGPSVLRARRPLETGALVVNTRWSNDDPANVSIYRALHHWNLIDVKDRLMPAADQAFSALRGARCLPDETLVAWTGEFSRSRCVDQALVGGDEAGRDGGDHRTHCVSTVLAEPGIRGGIVSDASARAAADLGPAPVTPAGIAASIELMPRIGLALGSHEQFEHLHVSCTGIFPQGALV